MDEKEVFERYGNACANCGAETHLAVYKVVPSEVGVTLRVTNHILLCRACYVSLLVYEGTSRDRALNFRIPRKLYESLQVLSSSAEHFRPLSRLVSILIKTYARKPLVYPPRKDSSGEGSDWVRVNAWVDPKDHLEVKLLVARDHTSVSEVLRRMLVMYLEEVVPRIEGDGNE